MLAIQLQMQTKKLNKVTTYLIFIWIVAVVVAAYPALTTQAQPLMCSERASLLSGLKENFNEVLTEQGLGSNGVLIGITVSPQKKWTLLMVPKHNPYSYCVVVRGSHWKQDPSASTGLLDGGNSLMSIGFDDDLNWTLIIVDYKTKEVYPVFDGYAWDRIKDINIQEQSL